MRTFAQFCVHEIKNQLYLAQVASCGRVELASRMARLREASRALEWYLDQRKAGVKVADAIAAVRVDHPFFVDTYCSYCRMG